MLYFFVPNLTRCCCFFFFKDTRNYDNNTLWHFLSTVKKKKGRKKKNRNIIIAALLRTFRFSCYPGLSFKLDFSVSLMPLILLCSISWHEQACFYRSDQQWTDSQINNSKGLKQRIRKKSVLSGPKSSLQVKEAFGAVYFDFISMSAVRPAREQILYLYLCSRHLPVVSYEKV